MPKGFRGPTRVSAMLTDKAEHKLVTNPHVYNWPGFGVSGAMRQAISPMDAVIEVIQFKLRPNVPKRTDVLIACGVATGSMSHHRYSGQPVSHWWLFCGAIYSGIPYAELCAVAGVEPMVEPYDDPITDAIAQAGRNAF